MEYNDFIRKVRDLDFIKDQDTADAAVKAVLGILTSRLKEPLAHKLTDRLPEPLSYEKLRSHQKSVAIAISVESYVSEIATQFNISRDQAGTLVKTVLNITKNALDPATLDEFKQYLSSDWDEALDKA